MTQQESFFRTLYKNFNDRHIELVIDNMTEDVQWANGMEGGYVYGHKGVREYWTRQFSLVSPHVTPLQIDDEKDVVKINVHQVVYDLNGNLLVNELVVHCFYMKHGKIERFEIMKKP